jgi:hypothetical protein
MGCGRRIKGDPRVSASDLVSASGAADAASAKDWGKGSAKGWETGLEKDSASASAGVDGASESD